MKTGRGAARRRRIIVYIAVSADGYIARADGSVDWLDRPRIKGDYGMPAFLKSIDTILWGRRTYDQARAMGEKAGSFGRGVKSYVFTRQPPPAPEAGVEFVEEPVREFVSRLRAQAGKDIWMMGGAEIIASFLDAGEIDELMIHVVPTLIGEGIPLMQRRHRLVPLQLRGTRSFSDGVVLLHYAVVRRVAAPRPRRKRVARAARRA